MNLQVVGGFNPVEKYACQNWIISMKNYSWWFQKKTTPSEKLCSSKWVHLPQFLG